MPAAAVIPAPIAYVNVAAVETLVVEGLAAARRGSGRGRARRPARLEARAARCAWRGVVYCEEIRVFQAGVGLHTAAWNDEIGPWAISLVAVRGNG